MRITEHTIGAVVVVAVEGHIDGSNSSELEDVLCVRMQFQPAVIIDMTRVPYISSAGLGTLLKTAKIARKAAHRLVLAGLAPQVGKAFDSSGFNGIFHITPDLAAAHIAMA